MGMRMPKVPTPDRERPRSLRLRLVLWYGALLAVALGLFVVLLLVLTMDAISQSVDGDVQAEARIAALNVHNSLSEMPPYWPPILTLNVIDTYGDPGIVVEVLDAQGHIHYYSANGRDAHVPISASSTRAALAGQITWFIATTRGERVRVEVLPVHAPIIGASSNAGEARGGQRDIIGILVVSKSMDDVDDTFFLLQTLLLIAGLVILVGALTGGWVIATRVLHPLTEIVMTASTIAANAQGMRIGGLSQRVRRPRGRDEMAQVVDTFNEMLVALEKATRAHRRFVADASHELRAPLTTIQGNLAFMQRHVDELPKEERRTMITDAHEETLRLARLVEDLLLLARADASTEMPITLKEEADQAATDSKRKESLLELDHTVLQLVRQLSRRLSVEGSKLKLEVGHIEAVRVSGDEESLRRVMLILLDNAIKYTSAGNGAGSGRVIVSLERLDKETVLRVRDDGIGIDAADLPHIFERFYRADRARTRQGTGLGLSIAQTLVERLGGRITAESTPGQGSMFSIWLPLA
jgi:two-component system, OmpR family, sensor kinase